VRKISITLGKIKFSKLLCDFKDLESNVTDINGKRYQVRLMMGE